jgi:hypothetical protein
MSISSPFEFLHLVARDSRSSEAVPEGGSLVLVCLWSVAGLIGTAILLSWGFGIEAGPSLTLPG